MKYLLFSHIELTTKIMRGCVTKRSDPNKLGGPRKKKWNIEDYEEYWEY